jgi:hypothetical protein
MSKTTHDSGSGLAPDEKLCPYCAETIKAAAIRCRFCQSDLPVPRAGSEQEVAPTEDVEPTLEVEPVETADVAPEPEPDAEPQSGPDAEPDPGPALDLPGSGLARATGGSTRLVAALLVLCLVLAGTLWFLVDRSRHPHLDTAPNGQVTQGSFRNAAMSAASDAAGQALSYSYKTFDADRAKARALMGSALAKQYDDAMNQVAAQTAGAKLTLQATVLSVGVVSATEHKAKVLLFVNTVTTREGSKKQQLDQNRVLMELTRKDGGWTVSKMDAF